MTTCRSAPEWCQIRCVNPPDADWPADQWFNWKRRALDGMLASESLSGANA